MATRTAPGLLRRSDAWPFVRWPDHQPQAWRDCLEQARDLRRPWRGVVQGNDVHGGALGLAAKDAEAAGVGRVIRFSQGDCGAWVPELKPDLLVTNPPWGTRLLAGGGRGGAEGGRGGAAGGGSETSAELEGAWSALSQFVKTQCGGATAYVLSGNVALSQGIKMRCSERWGITVGGQETMLLQYQVRSSGGGSSGGRDSGMGAAARTAA
jgi:23S rRNA G2445 N2-methylase RlmL